MSIFEIVKAEVTVKEAARYYGMKSGRNDMVCCPFHNDRHPSMKLNDRYYYCFGCGTSGDVVSLVAKLFGISNYEAARKLADDFGIDPDPTPTCGALKKPVLSVYQEQKAQEQEHSIYQRRICEHLHQLEDWKEQYAPTDPDKEFDERFVEACHELDYVEYIAYILTFGSKEKVQDMIAMLKDSRLIEKLEMQREKIISEVKSKGEERYGREQEAA